MKYDESIPIHFKNNNPTLFLSQNVSKNIRDKFYNREFTIEDFKNNKELLDIFGNTNIVCGMKEEYAWLIPLLMKNENQKVVQRFLNENPKFELQKILLQNDIKNAKEFFEKYLVDEQFLQVYQNQKTDGFFICKIRKKRQK